MKIRITFKDPDSVFESAQEAAAKSLKSINGLTDSEISEITDTRTEQILTSIKQWVKYQEYVTIEFDTEQQTATVIKANP